MTPINSKTGMNYSIFEGNELIAEFMGAEITHDDVAFFPDGRHYYTYPKPNKTNILKYHDDWNWIMNVVEKIELIDILPNDNSFNVIIGASNSCMIFECTNGDIIDADGDMVEIMSDGDKKIMCVWNAIVQFIDWFNSIPDHNPDDSEPENDPYEKIFGIKDDSSEKKEHKGIDSIRFDDTLTQSQMDCLTKSIKEILEITIKENIKVHFIDLNDSGHPIDHQKYDEFIVDLRTSEKEIYESLKKQLVTYRNEKAKHRTKLELKKFYNQKMEELKSKNGI